MAAGKQLVVYSVREKKNGTVWIKVGTAFVNRDESLNVYLDALPVDGKLHLREKPAVKGERAQDGGNELDGAAAVAAAQSLQ